MSKRRVVVFGCQKIAIDMLSFLAEYPDLEVSLVVTYEVISDISRGQESVIETAKKMGFETINPPYISNDLVLKVNALKPDLIISAYFRKILPKELIDIPKLGAINIHPSFLPFYRGPVPTAWAIWNGEKRFGVTIHKIDSGIDTGDILFQEEYSIGDEETGYELYMRAMDLGTEMLTNNFDSIINETAKSKKQGYGGSYYGKMDNKVFINWRNTAESIRNQIRVRAKPYNPAETMLMNKYVFINRASIYQDNRYTVQRPGRIVQVLDQERLVVACADGALVLEDYDIYPRLNEKEKCIYLVKGRQFSDGL